MTVYLDFHNHMTFPFTYLSIFKNFIGNSRSILDVGCGNGIFFSLINTNKKYDGMGVDLFHKYILMARKTGAYTKVIEKDIRKINFSSRSFDVVISSQVVEHLTKKEGFNLLVKMEVIAKKRVIIGTPNGHFHQEAYDENDLQKHKSHWSVKDFQDRGYKVYGQGLKAVYGEGGLMEKFKDTPLKYLLYIFSYIYSPFVYFNPNIAAHIVAVKNI